MTNLIIVTFIQEEQEKWIYTMSKIIYDTVSFFTRNFPINKGKGRLVDWVLNSDFDRYTCVTKANDGRLFPFDSHTRHNFQIFFFGEREKHETKIVNSLVAKGDTVFDIGANVGWYTTLISNLIGQSGKIYAFEPIPQNFKNLTKALELNNCADNVILFNNLCGEKVGVGSIYEFPNLHPGLCSAKPIVNQKKIEHKIKIVVLDEVIKKFEIERIDFIKIDVEGAELEVLKGCITALKNKLINSIMIEVNEERSSAFGYSFQSVFDLIYTSAPYEVYKINSYIPHLRKLQTTSDFYTGDNLFFLRKESAKINLLNNLLTL